MKNHVWKIIFLVFITLSACVSYYLMVYTNKTLSSREIEASAYAKQLELCEKEILEKFNDQEASTHADLINMSYDINTCYKNIGIEIINKYYSKNALKLKEDLNKFVSASYNISSDISMLRDDCLPNCGNMFVEISINNAGMVLKQIIEDMIYLIKIDDF